MDATRHKVDHMSTRGSRKAYGRPMSHSILCGRSLTYLKSVQPDVLGQDFFNAILCEK